MRRTLLHSFLTAMLLVPIFHSRAQDIHLTQVDAAPLAVNPAFTGGFNGGLRASAFYMNQWAYVTIPYISYGLDIDLPVYVTRHGDYIAAGVQIITDKAGDGNLNNFTAVASVAFHKSFALFSKERKRNSDLSIGLQTGYAQSSIDLYNMRINTGFISLLQYQYTPGLNEVNYTPVNAGVSFSQALSPRVNYIIGIAGYDLNQPKINWYSEHVVPGTRCTIAAGANWQATERLTLRPLAYYQLRQSGNELTAGNEFNFAVGKQRKHTSLFFGIYYQTEDVFSATAGSEFHAFRLSICYVKYTHPDTEAGSNGSGRFEIAARYILHHKPNRIVPCNRF